MDKQPNNRPAHRWAQRFTKQRLEIYSRMMAPALVALALATAAHAQGSVDMSGGTIYTSVYSHRSYTGQPSDLL